MALVQTKIQFNERKKRLNPSTLGLGKENSVSKKCSSKLSVQHMKEQFQENFSQHEESLPENCSSTENDEDSDIEYIFENCKKSGNRTPRNIKRQQSRQAPDKCKDDADLSSPPKRDKKSDISECNIKNDISSPRTPSQFIARLHIRTPNETANNVAEDQKHLSPKCLFSPGSTYQQVRIALQGCSPTTLPGRENHLNQLHSFLQKHLVASSSGTLYISGPPGTGKTACLSKIMDVPEFKNGFKIINVNCTSMKSSSSIYARIAQELSLKVTKRTEKEYLLNIEKFLASKHKIILLVLDEIDQLDSKKQSVLYTVFEWPSKANSKLVLVGIANALDLTDRILPRLQARLDLKPDLIHFTPYTKMEIVNILTEKLKQSNVADIFPKSALHLLAGKVASTCGDVRRALDISRRVVELAEAQKNQILPLQPTMDHVINTSSPRKSPRKNPDSSIALKEVMSVLNSVYGTSQSLDTDTDESFPLQQKVLVCTQLLILKKGRNKDVTVGKLHEVYRRVCNKRNLLAVDQSEFFSLCQLVETRGILKVQSRKETRLSKVCLQWDEEEVSAALKDKQLLSSILNDISCL